MSDRSSPLLQLQGVSLTDNFGSNYLLENISLKLFSGEIVTLTGPSGAGKTSLLRLLNRLVDPTSGSITFQEQPVLAIPVLQLRRQVVLVPQEPKLLGMNVRDALVYPLKLQKLSPITIRERLEKYSRQLKLETDWLEREELQLSLGEKQVVAITRALMLEPKILLLDEPTSALDLGRARQILSVVINLVKDNSQAVIVASHQLELAAEFSQRLFYLEAGRLLWESKTTEVNWSELRVKLTALAAREVEEWQL